MFAFKSSLVAAALLVVVQSTLASATYQSNGAPEPATLTLLGAALAAPWFMSPVGTRATTPSPPPNPAGGASAWRRAAHPQHAAGFGGGDGVAARVPTGDMNQVAAKAAPSSVKVAGSGVPFASADCATTSSAVATRLDLNANLLGSQSGG